MCLYFRTKSFFLGISSGQNIGPISPQKFRRILIHVENWLSVLKRFVFLSNFKGTTLRIYDLLFEMRKLISVESVCDKLINNGYLDFKTEFCLFLLQHLLRTSITQKNISGVHGVEMFDYKIEMSCAIFSYLFNTNNTNNTQQITFPL